MQDLEIAQIFPTKLVGRIGDVLEDNMGGTIGARACPFLTLPLRNRLLTDQSTIVFAIFFTAWSSALASSHESLPQTLRTALESLHHHTPAKPGDRTIIDALEPFCTSLANGEGFDQATKKAKKGAENTRGMKARLGRAVYVGDGSKPTDFLPPDPGAWGIAAIIEGFFRGYY